VAEARTLRRAALDGDGDGRAQDGIHLPPLRHRGRSDDREAAAKLDTWNSEQQAKAEAARKGQVQRFKKRRRREC